MVELSIELGDFNLKFYGKDHAEIDPKTPVAQNIGVLVNNQLYYPGDSFTPCPEKFKILAIPASAPWLRVGQTIPTLSKNQIAKQSSQPTTHYFQT